MVDGYEDGNLMLALDIQNASKSLGGRTIFSNVNLQIPVGQIVALVGPSGCGKSTFFRAIVGTHLLDDGVVIANEKEVTTPNCDVGIVYQHYSLYDFLPVEDNVAIGLKFSRTSIPFRIFRPMEYRRVYKQFVAQGHELLDMVQLSDAKKKYPDELSGGMRQRAALAAALITKPSVLLLDEPFGALDEIIREDLQMMLLNLHRVNLANERFPSTIVIVTHQLKEALFVADRIIGLSQHHPRAAELGATIVYDMPSPSWRPLSSSSECEGFFQQEDEIRRVVYEPGSDNGDGKYIQPYLTPTVTGVK